ncbi:MAG: hypothetical protein DRH17_12850 [Deltaproteobacteria bacterium]|nr:MAG: hypothetical protein DRH17_12850 [Deltaproteobacteria bacterium]
MVAGQLAEEVRGILANIVALIRQAVVLLLNHAQAMMRRFIDSMGSNPLYTLLFITNAAIMLS